mgnify:CR=1 FL=1
MRKKIITLEELEQEVQKARQQKQMIVSTSGCFDVLHAGHETLELPWTHNLFYYCYVQKRIFPQNLLSQ